MSKKRLLASAATIIVLLAVSALLLFLAQGYRIDLKKRTVKPTGILVVSSTPDGALIYLNDVPKDATNTSLTTLSPGTYQLRLAKQGYASYQRKVTVKKELVTKIEAVLVPLFPELKPLTYTGAASPLLAPDGSKIIYRASQNSEAGLWILDLANRPFNLNSPASLVLPDTAAWQYSQMQPSFSPDSKQLLLQETSNKGRGPSTRRSFLFDLSSKETLELNQDELDKTLKLWQKQTQAKEQKRLEGLPPDLSNKITQLTDPVWSPDGTKILYKKETSAKTLYQVLDLKPPAASTKTGGLLSASPTNPLSHTPMITREYQVFSRAKDRFAQLSWYPDSRHLLVLQKDSPEAKTGLVSLAEIDGGNPTKIFNGYLQDNFIASSTNGSKIVILTNFNPQSKQYNLYSINLR